MAVEWERRGAAGFFMYRAAGAFLFFFFGRAGQGPNFCTIEQLVFYNQALQFSVIKILN